MQMQKSKPETVKYVWYLWAIDDNPTTNNFLVKVIGEQNGEYLRKDVRCSDGVKRNLFECPEGYKNVRVVIAAKSEFFLDFEVFRQQNGGAIAPFVIWKLSHRRNAQEAAQINRMRRKVRHESEKK